MAFNIQTFKTRALTAIIFVVIMLFGLLWDHWSFLILFTIIHFGCWVEYQKLISLIDPAYAAINNIHKYGVMLAGWGMMLWATNNAYTLGTVHLNEVGKWLFLLALAIVLFSALMKYSPKTIRSLLYSSIGLIYISLSWSLMMRLRCKGMFVQESRVMIDLGWVLPITIIASIWINDTMAYIVGSFIGKTPFSKISPKKTWEGTIGGAILCIATVTLAGYYIFHLTEVVNLVVISSIAAIIGTIGDLLESKLKRMANVKDSSHIMPGHGGFLDRFDSLILATPFVWLYFIAL